MSRPLIFVLAPAAALPAESSSMAELEAAQATGLSSGFALRIFNKGGVHADLGKLPLDGRLTGEQRRSSDGTQLLCDAVIPRIEPQHHWLGVYQADSLDGDSLRCLDRFPLSEASNATCWFYPTHDGTFLSWERGLELTLAPGSIAESPQDLLSEPYARGCLVVLWSLLADDASLTCVGLTYGGQRIDWPVRTLRAEPMATWARFCVDSQAESSLVVEDCLTVFNEPPASA